MHISEILPRLIEVSLPKPESFLVIKETLTRIGIANTETKCLYQSCMILHKKGHYYVVHFNEMYMLDGLRSWISTEDIARRNTIASMLEEWGMMTILQPSKVNRPRVPYCEIFVLPYKKKAEWTLVPKYMIGRVQKNAEEKAS